MFWSLITCFACGLGYSVMCTRKGSSSNPYHALQGWPEVFPKRFQPLGRSGNLSLFHSPPLQSPIDIRFRRTARVNLSDLQIHHLLSPDVTMKMENTGHSVQFVVADESRMRPRMVGGPLSEFGEYEFDNLHVHWGSRDRDGGEHELNGKRYAVEGHCVHFNLKYGTMKEAMNHRDGLAVVAFFAKAEGGDNPMIGKVLKMLPNITMPHSSMYVHPQESVHWFAELVQPTGYLSYPGSLTTEPFTENVIWIVYPKPMHLSHGQINAFRNLRSSDYSQLDENTRAIQSFNDRPCLFAM